jgi:hypothetical protein
VSESGLNSTDVVPQHCCHCIARGQALRSLSGRCAGSDKHSAEPAIASRSSGGPTMIEVCACGNWDPSTNPTSRIHSVGRNQPVGSKYSADHEVQWRTSVRSPGANNSPSNRALDPVRPDPQDRTRRSRAESRDRFPRLSQPDAVDLQLKCRNPPAATAVLSTTSSSAEFFDPTP